jgi:hypothetical protein
MLLNILQQEWAQILLSAVALGIAGIISYLFRLLQIWISTKIKNERIREAMREISEEVEASVMSVYQTYVEELKRTGNFDKAAKSKALNNAISKTIQNLTTSTKETIQKEAIDMAQLIKDRVEAKIAESKNVGFMKSSEDLYPTAKKTIKG